VDANHTQLTANRVWIEHTGAGLGLGTLYFTDEVAVRDSDVLRGLFVRDWGVDRLPAL
jgi:hypothetical protein